MPAYVYCPKCDARNEISLMYASEGLAIDMDYKPFKCKKCGAGISNDQMLTYEMVG